MEVFVQDWKSHDGWNQLTKQPGNEGACRSVILSLLVDHCLAIVYANSGIRERRGQKNVWHTVE